MQRGGWSPRQLDAVLADLEDRGLLGWDRATNRYDLHPVVRGVVWSGLDNIRRQAVYGTLRQHFSSIPTTSNRAETVKEALPLIELFNALIGLARYAEAADLYFTRIHRGGFDFANAGMGHVRVALFESLFPNGLDRPPTVQSLNVTHVYSQLGHSYAALGRLAEANSYAVRALDSKPAAADLRVYVAERALALGHLEEALYQAKLAVTARNESEKFALGWEGYEFECLALCKAAAGKSRQALLRLYVQSRYKFSNPQNPEARIRLWQDDFERAAALAQNLLPKFSDFLITRCRFTLTLAEARMNLGHVEEAVDMLMGVLREAREKSVVEPELISLRCLASGSR